MDKCPKKQAENSERRGKKGSNAQTSRNIAIL